MVKSARVVIIGGGIAGCSVALRLAELGRSDCLLLEQHDLASGATWHAAGLCTQFQPTLALGRMAARTISLCERLEKEVPGGIGWHQVGSLRLAASADQLAWCRRVLSRLQVLGVPGKMLDSHTISELWPLGQFGDSTVAAYLRDDGYVDPSRLVNALAGRATAAGVTIRRHARVDSIERDPAGGWAVQVDGTCVHCETVVDAAGQDAGSVARMVGGELPLVPLQHQYVITAGSSVIRALASELPVLRDPQASFYVRQDQDGLLVGPFESNPVLGPDGRSGRPPYELLTPDLSRIETALLQAADRIPHLAELGIRTVVNGTDAYTPDGHPLLGPMPGYPDFFVLAGFSIFGIVLGPGAGACVAEWIVSGEPPDDVRAVDVARFGSYANSNSFLAPRALDTYSREYAVHFPYEETPVGLPVRRSPLHEVLTERGAVFSEVGGWERPLWFRSQARSPVPKPTLGVPSWFSQVGSEGRAVRREVGLIDQTSLAKLDVSGRDAASFLRRVFANALPRATGDITVGQCLTRSGAIVSDVTITRRSVDRFYIVSACAAATNDLGWLRGQLVSSEDVAIVDVTETRGVLTVAGPGARRLLAPLCDVGLDSSDFPPRQARDLSVGGIPVLAIRMPVVGELAWELHHSVDDSRALYRLIREQAGEIAPVDFGYQCFDALRMEKGHPMWGAELAPPHTPIEAGLANLVDWSRLDFTGAEAIRRQREEGVRRKLVSLVVQEHGSMPAPADPVYLDGEAQSVLTSVAWGPCTDEMIAMAYLPADFAKLGTVVEVGVLGEACSAEVVQPVRYKSK